jgi:hypothetical protein
MSRLAAANGSITGLRNGAARVSTRDVNDALDRTKRRFDTPKATSAKYREFVPVRHVPT